MQVNKVFLVLLSSCCGLETDIRLNTLRNVLAGCKKLIPLTTSFCGGSLCRVTFLVSIEKKKNSLKIQSKYLEVIVEVIMLIVKFNRYLSVGFYLGQFLQGSLEIPYE